MPLVSRINLSAVLNLGVLVITLSFTACTTRSTLDAFSINADSSAPVVKLYAMDCGTLEVPDADIFGSKGEYQGVSGIMPVTCFLIRHPRGDLLWDAGLPDELHSKPDPDAAELKGIARQFVPVTLESQLVSLGVSVSDVEYFSISHSHFDHVGNANLFSGSTTILSKAEFEHMFSDESRQRPDFKRYHLLEHENVELFSGNYDVFGDGSVEILEMPGHTPGHSVLKVDLINAGTVLLTGDLYHFEQSRERRITPAFNFDIPMTLRSMDTFEALAKKERARVFISHSIVARHWLPRPPEYLD